MSKNEMFLRLSRKNIIEIITISVIVYDKQQNN